MNNIQQLIQQLCPNGVEYKRLGEVCEIVPARKKIKTHAYLSSGKYPVIDQGQKFIGGYTDEEEGVIDRDEYVIFGDHTCIVKFVDFMFFPGADGVKILSANRKIITPKFMYYCMCNIHMESSYSRHWAKVNKEEIPLPPLPVQRAIAAVLDRFTQLETELETELQCRKKQYEYYRDSLLNFDNDNVQWVKLGDICFYPKQRIGITKDLCYIGVEDIVKNRGGVSKNFDKNHAGTAISFEPGDILIGNIRPYLKKIWLADCNGGTNGDVVLIRRKTKEISEKYLYFTLSSDKFFMFMNATARGGKMPRGDKKRILGYEIPLPPLSVQRRIVGILDRFEALTTSISEGLPAEIEARRRQYEYYRDRLLTFKRKEQ